jgi:hypothetical protein
VRTRRGAASTAALVLLATGASGCGGKSDAARVSCRTTLINEANAAVVQRYYAEGRLGSRRRIERELGRYGPRFFGRNGRMVPYRRLSRSLQGDFNNWMYGNGRVQHITRAAQQRATDEATKRADHEC